MKLTGITSKVVSTNVAIFGINGFIPLEDKRIEGNYHVHGLRIAH